MVGSGEATAKEAEMPGSFEFAKRFRFCSSFLSVAALLVGAAQLPSAEPDQEFQQLDRAYRDDGWTRLNSPEYKMRHKLTEVWVNGKQLALKERTAQIIRWYVVGSPVEIPMNSSVTTSHELRIDGVRTKLVFDNGTTVETELGEKLGHFVELEKAGAKITYKADKVDKRLLKLQKCYELETAAGKKKIFSNEEYDVIFEKR
jgi:hypothetical protein